jgi:ribosome maturation factor RimP
MSSTEMIRELTEPLLVGTGLELWDIELTKGIVRVLVDREGGVDLDALARASTAVSSLLDDHPDVVPGEAYQLEVSSPGIERTLRTPEQYRRYLGALVATKAKVAVDGARRWRGRLASADEDGIVLVVQDAAVDSAVEGAAVEDGANAAGRVVLRYDQIDRTRTVLEWGSDQGIKQAGGSPRWSDPRGKGGARRSARSGTEVKETP